MRDLAVVMSEYRLTVVEEPGMKLKRDGSGPVLDRDGVAQFVVSVFAKRLATPGEFAAKGEELRVTLATDPGEGFQEGLRVELVDPRVNAWEIRDDETGRVSSGLAFKALGLKPVMRPRDKE
ncbi:MAG: hypothetical protein M3Z25_17595 [Actinomycetota bacterium]|nr:hypothetical protein [Actinomycetota bacterium]